MTTPFPWHCTSPRPCGATESLTRRRSPAPATFSPPPIGGRGCAPSRCGWTAPRPGIGDFPHRSARSYPRRRTWHTRPTPWWTPMCTSSTRPTSRRAARDGATSSRRIRRRRPQKMGSWGRSWTSDILRACASTPDDCPCPARDKVVFLAQAHCDGLYHVMAEVWPRIRRPWTRSRRRGRTQRRTTRPCPSHFTSAATTQACSENSSCW